MKKLTLILLLGAVFLAACGGGGDKQGAEREQALNTVINYLNAKAGSDEAGIRANICSAMEADVEQETFSFAGVNAQLEGASCTIDLDASSATCSGYITIEYGQGDTREFPLSTYNIVKDDGLWKWCGEASTAG